MRTEGRLTVVEISIKARCSALVLPDPHHCVHSSATVTAVSQAEVGIEVVLPCAGLNLPRPRFAERCAVDLSWLMHLQSQVCMHLMQDWQNPE